MYLVSVVHIPDGSTELYFQPIMDRRFVSYGWLGTHCQPVGVTSDEAQNAFALLADAQELHEGTLGFHQCEVCHEFEDRSSFFVEIVEGEVCALLPRMVLHYVAAHRYKLPTDIEEAAIRQSKLVPSPIMSFRIDCYLRQVGYEPCVFDGECLTVRPINPRYDLADLCFILKMPVKLAG